MCEATQPRYTTRPFPPYSYVPGSGTPHPVSDPRGHMHGAIAKEPAALDPRYWQQCEIYLYAVDLFNHGYYWEAHEAWESLWHAAGHHGPVADFLKGFIKLAAAGVKHREGNATGVIRHLQRGQELLRSVGEAHFCGVDLLEVITSAVQSAAESSDYTPRVRLRGFDHGREEKDLARET